MKRIPTIELVPGMKVAQNVLNFNRQLIVSQGTVLTDNLITKLDAYGILDVYIEEEPKEPPQPVAPPHVSSYSERVKSSPVFQQFKEDYEHNIDSFRDAINNVVEKNIQLDVKKLLSDSLEVISNSNGQIGVLDMLHNMREYDDSTFAHCMNVGLICNVFANWLKMNEEEVELATACGLLHDIGKLLVPRSIITKPGKLSAEEYAAIQKHPVRGYDMLVEQNVDEHICNAALMHHERSDGTGYPGRLAGDQIDKYARIVAIADVYDAMTAARVYRGPMCPFRVIEIFESEGFQRYDVQYLLVFLENVVNTYLQNRCRLNNNQTGEIIYINREKFSRPVVKCGNQYLNLLEHPELSIVEIL
ncbi:MAG: HD-GYP domain-containing protein [Lachnospiraceae bacterium]|nr:HD-GYP domain-containing protein [Lachnospiraceae bacterium]